MGTIVQAVAALAGADQVRSWEAVPPDQQQAIAAAIASDTPPAGVAYPDSQEALAAVMACAHRHGWRLMICGQGSKLTWGRPISAADLVICTAGLNRIVDHAAGDLTLTVEAGARFEDVQAQLAKAQQCLGFDPAYGDRATLGGIVATADTGSLRQRYGSIRDMLIGVSFVRHDGQVVKAGGRVVKNVAGYDLMKLMTGAYGTLGVLTQLTFRTYPLAAASQTLLFTGSPDAVAALTAAVRRSSLTPVALDGLSSRLLPQAPSQETVGMVAQFQNVTAAVTEQGQRLQAMAQDFAVTPQVLVGDAEASFWQRLQHTLWPSPETEAVIAKIGVLPAEAISLLQFFETALPAGVECSRIHAGSGVGILQIQREVASAELLATVRSRCQGSGGYCVLLTGPASLKQQFDPWGIQPPTQRLMQSLKAQFDPQDRLNPTKFAGSSA